ncbi:unnamed protein product (macronuclear) [Paramecium tetraurelia]|uniref:EGF-like domain-containing protein n=1 Tax=Paramecium tetraurelia TaxID=5888 RepID=A0C307_PARTE|nr:uncharacterized protein GSPATT00034652001 [Paramecium tetraurelia]CAK65174.1 unnamed protein product [Paramecium tetraurelia]|eukprot:XP_001432571.1 hypothetical protein (macronuclear) [Paramecium tetraurelia strain d4-2]
MKIILVSLLIVASFANVNRVLSEISQTSNKWQFNLFTSTAEQNSQTYLLEGEELLLVQNIISGDGNNQIKMNKYLRDGTEITSPKIIGDSTKACSKARITLIPTIGFVAGWIQKTESSSQLYLQLFTNNLTALGEQILVSDISQEVHWDLSSEYYYIYNLGNYQLLLLYKQTTSDKSWSGTIYNYNSQQRSSAIKLSNSKFVEIAQNSLGNLILVQRIYVSALNSYLIATKINQNGEIVYTKNIYHIRLQSQFEPRLVALSNNNFVVFYQQSEFIYYQVYNQHFDSVLFASYSKYYGQQTPTWEFNNFFKGSQIQVLALEGSVILVGVNYNTLRFQLIQLDNEFLEFIQQREIHYEDLNIYKFSIQKTNDETIFVQWISGNPLTLLPEFTQSLYQSELNLKLTLSNCAFNCDHCENNVCQKCNNGYVLNNKKCQLQCQTNCVQCSTKNSCDVCASGYVLNNKMQCVNQSNSANTELKVSISESTYKYNQQVKQFQDGSLLVYYSEYSTPQQVLQFRVLSSDGEIIQAHQLNYSGWAGYDVALVNDTTAYLYTLETSEGSTVIKQRQFNPKTFEFTTIIRLQIQNQGFSYRKDVQNNLIVAGFENSVCLILKGMDSGDNINLNLGFYTYNGEFLINQNLGQVQFLQNYSYNEEERKFDYDFDEQYLYILIARGCSLQLVQFNLVGQRVYEESFGYGGYVFCQDFINPSLSKISNKYRFMIAMETVQGIIVFNWKDSTVLYTTDSKVKARKPQLNAFKDNIFVLLFEEYDLSDRFTTIQYLRFEFTDVVVNQSINSNSVLPQNLKTLNQDNEYLILSWLAHGSSKISSTNQVYLERVLLNDNLIVGFGKQCPSNCQNCNSDKACLQCNEDYQLTADLSKCVAQCPQGCATCATKDQCLVCQFGYQLSQLNVCEQSQKNTIAILKENTQIFDSIDLDLAQNGNLYVSWMQRDENNNQQTFIKQIDVHGQQVGQDISVNVCTQYASKIYTTSYLNILSTICGNLEFGADMYLHFYTSNFDTRYQFWVDHGIRMISYSIGDTPYAIQVISEKEVLIAYQIMNSETEVYVRFIKLCKQDFDNLYFYCGSSQFGPFNQKVQDLQLAFDYQVYYINYKILVQQEDGSIQLQTFKITTDFNCQQVNILQTFTLNQQTLILSNLNKLDLSINNAQISFTITHGNKQLNQHTIELNNQNSDLQIEQVDVAATESGFYVVWIEQQQTKQIKAQGFYNNGTQITEIQNLIQSSYSPSKIFVQSVRNNQLIIVWQDQDQNGQKLLATRYNQMLQLLPLNTVLCQYHCENCQAANSCAKCSQGYYYNTDQSQCQLICPSYCQVCTQKDVCDICQTNYYLVNDQCVYDAQKQKERVLADVEDSTVTRVSVSAFSDNGFVVVWNDNVDGKQQLVMQIYNNLKEQQRSLPLSGENDKQYAQVEVLDGDLIALAWFEGQCSVSCRLQLQIFDRFGTIQSTEITIAFVTLPSLGKQKPVVIKRFDRKLIIAYITYENGKTVGYSTMYEQDSSSVQANQLIDPDQNIDNLNIISLNGYYHGIMYVRNNKELYIHHTFQNGCFQGCGYFDGAQLMISSDYQISQPSAFLRQDNFFIVLWVEKSAVNGFLIEKTYQSRCWNWGCDGKKQVSSNQFDETYLPQSVGQYLQYGYQRYSIIYGSQDYPNHIRRTIKLQSFNDYYQGMDKKLQINVVSQKIEQFVTYEFQNGDVLVISVGQTSESSSQILLNLVTVLGDQQKLMGNPTCQQRCQRCDASLTCFNCNAGYTLIDGQCLRQCDKNCAVCDRHWESAMLQCNECEFGYKLNNFQQCLPTDTTIIQSLINTYQSGNQYGQRIATLSNYQSVVVWNSENQDKNGKSIYMQLYDQQMNKIGGETLVTKDNIGVQEEPDVVALPNNHFIIIWKDNHSNAGRRILMQRFSLAFERLGDEIVVYDSTTDIISNLQSLVNYVDVHHKITVSLDGSIFVLLYLQQSYNIFDIRFKQFNSNYEEYSSLSIWQTTSYQQTSTSTLNNLLLFTFKSQEGIRVFFINQLGSIVNRLLIPNSKSYSYPSIISISENEILIACVGSKLSQLLVYKQNLDLSSTLSPQMIDFNNQITDVNLLNMNSGYVIAFKQLNQTPYYQSDLVNLLIFNSLGDVLSSDPIQVNDYYGSTTDIRLARLSNDDFIITWTQIINSSYGVGLINQRNIDDLSGDGVYVKRYNVAGQVQSIQNVVCQSYCKQCSKSNLCEACMDGYQFDQQKLICLPICQSHCNQCTRFLGQYKSYCQQCAEGYTNNDQGDCVKVQEQQIQQLYELYGDYVVSQILTLSNGNIVILYQANGGDKYLMNIIDSSGKVVLKGNELTLSCCRKLTKATALTGGNFAVIQRSFDVVVEGFQLFVYDQEGRLIKQDILYNPYYWGYPEFWRNQNLLQINSLSDGGFVILFVSNNDGYISSQSPKLHLRIYNKEYYLVKQDIVIQTYFNRNEQWDYWNYDYVYNNQRNQAIQVLESVNSIIISFGTSIYNKWEENKNNIQVFVYSKEGQFILNKAIEIPNNDWWVGYTPRINLFEIEINKYLLVYFNNRQVYGQFYDQKFNLQVEKSINLESLGGLHCYGCCIGCWDQITSQVAVVKNVIVITNKPNGQDLYISAYNLNFNQIVSPFKISNNKYDATDYLRNQHFLVNYQLETLLLAQVVQFKGSRLIMFNKLDKNCNIIKQWTSCGENCIDCAENNQQCLECKSGYFVDETQKCKKSCDIQSCLLCENPGQYGGFCRICQAGYQLKDNTECVQVDSSRIQETKLSSSNHQAQNTPRIKTLLDGRILLISLNSNNKIIGQFYDSQGNLSGDQVTLLEEEGINHFDFSVSKTEDKIVLAWVSYRNWNAKSLKFSIDLQSKITEQLVIIDQVYQYSISQITVEFLQDNSYVCVLYGNGQNWIRTVNEFDQLNCFNQINSINQWFCDRWGCYDQSQFYQAQNRYIDYFSTSYEREPSILTTQNYIVLAYVEYSTLVLRTYDNYGNVQYVFNNQNINQNEFRQPYQPSVTLLENGKIVIVWKDVMETYNIATYEQQVPSYKQTVIAYMITDEQFRDAKVQYIGMDYIQEERPDVAAISNGFAISWSGRSERNNQNIDLRIAYFDLYGNLQTGFIPVSSICNRPINSQINKIADGSILVSWYQDQDIYVQKLDRKGVIYPLPQPIGCSWFCSKCNQEGCLECFAGYELNQVKECQIIVPKCNVENCQVCEYGWNRCMLCNEGYFLEDNFDHCTLIDVPNKEYKLAHSNVINDHSTSIVSVDDGTIIHLWLDTNDDGYVLKGSTYTQFGSQSIADKLVYLLPKDVFIQVKSQNSNVVVLIYNAEFSQILIVNVKLEIVKDKVDITSIIKEEFIISYEWQKQNLETFNDGFVVEITGVRQQVINQFDINPEIRKCMVVETLVFNFNIELTTQPFGFYMEGQPSTGIVDSVNNCKITKVLDVLYDDYIYVVSYQYDLYRQSLQVYNYRGEKLKEVWVNQQVPWYSYADYDGQRLFKSQDGKLYITGREGKGIILNIENFQFLEFLDYPLLSNYCIDYRVVRFLYSQELILGQQVFGLVSRWKYSIFRLWDQGFVSKFAVQQQSFNILELTDGQLLFSWIEASNNSNKGSIQIVRLNQSFQLDIFQRFACLPNCQQCPNDNTCDICNDHYENINKKECKVICPNLCDTCQYPQSCTICQDGAYLNDQGECYIPNDGNIEIPIPIKRSDNQINPRVASFSDGSFVVVWQAENQDGDGYGVYAQKFNSLIERIGDEIRVNEVVLNEQYYPDITILDNSNVIIVWADGQIESEATLYYQRFDKNLVRIGGPVILDKIKVQYIQQYDTPFVVQALPQNKFAVCWVNFADWNSNFYVTLIDSNGVSLNSYVWNRPDQVREIAIASNGLNFIVLIKQTCHLISNIFNLEGQFQYEKYIDFANSCNGASGITANSRGEYIVSFIEADYVRVSIYDTQFNQYGRSSKIEDSAIDTIADNPDVIALDGDKIAVVWQNTDRLDPIFKSRKLKMVILDYALVALTSVQEVNLITTFAQLPQLSRLNNNQYVVVWQAKNQKPNVDSEYGIYLMRYNSNGDQTNPGVPICPDKCEKCQESTTCIKCLLDYDLVDKECKPRCPVNCQYCNTSNICDICLPGFELDVVGHCIYITPDPIPYPVPMPEYPSKVNPSFKSIQKFGDTSVLIYGSSLIQVDSKYYLDISLILINDSSKAQLPYNNKIEIDGEWANVYNSDILVIDQEIVIYWTEHSYSVKQVHLKQIRLDSNLVSQGSETIDTFDFDFSEHTNRKVYLFALNGSYYIFQSIQYINGQFELYGHIVDRQLYTRAPPKKLMDTFNQLNRNQIHYINNEFVITQYTMIIFWRKFNTNLGDLVEGSTWPIFNGDIDYSSIIIQQLTNTNFVVAWRSKSQQPQSSSNSIKYMNLGLDFQPISSEITVVTSNDVLQSPFIVVTTSSFYVIWNQESVVSSILNCNQFSENGGPALNTIQKLNRLQNNVIFYTGTQITGEDIYVIWISYQDTTLEYQYQLVKIGPQGRLPNPIDPLPVCPTGCNVCQNEYSCGPGDCLPDYIYDIITHKCVMPCPSNCKQCSLPGQCNTCDEGYKLVNHLCVKNVCQAGCELCDEAQLCFKCPQGYEKVDQFKCRYACDVNCEICGEDKCTQCKESYYWSEKDRLCVDITIYIYQTTKEKPLKAVFESKDYVLMWYETGATEGIYIQLYRSNGKPVGRPTKVNEQDLLGTRRLLQQSNSFDVRLFADLAAIKNELVVLWVDQTQGDMMKLKFRKFDSNTTQMSEEITIKEQPRQNLTSMAAPCIIKPTKNNQFVIGWFNQQAQSLQQTATMFIQSYSSELKPIGELSTLLNADYTSVPLISASENGEVFITYTSQGYTYLAQMSQDGFQLGDPIQIAQPYQTIKSSNLDDGSMIYVFESKSTNVSPPLFVLQYQILTLDKKLNEPQLLTSQQYGEQQPDLLKINNGFVITWRSVDKTFKSQDVYFQVFDNSGKMKSLQIKVDRQGNHPQNPSIQLLKNNNNSNSDELVITWIAESLEDPTVNTIFSKQFKLSTIIIDPQTPVCSSKCLYCERNNTCMTCIPGYYTVNDQCEIDCPINCQSCSKPYVCDKCDQGYQFTADNQCEFVVACDAGFELNDENECVPICSDNCLVCQSQTSCLECSADYYLTKGICLQSLGDITASMNQSNQGMPIYDIIVIIVASLLFIGCLFYVYKRHQKNLAKREHGQQQLANQVEDSNRVPQQTMIHSEFTVNRGQPDNLQFD